MKKTKSILILSLLTVLAVSQTNAQCANGQIPSPFNPNCSQSNPSLGDIIARAVPFIPVAIGLILFGVITWGAVQIVLAGPNDEGKKKGFQTIQNAITGVVLLLVSVGIITLIEAIFGVKLLFGVFVR